MRLGPVRLLRIVGLLVLGLMVGGLLLMVCLGRRRLERVLAGEVLVLLVGWVLGGWRREIKLLILLLTWRRLGVLLMWWEERLVLLRGRRRGYWRKWLPLALLTRVCSHW